MDKFKDLQFPSDGFISNHLSKIIIDNGQKHTADIEILCRCSAINFRAITHLQLSDFSVYDAPQMFPSNLFSKLIALFPELQYLHLWRAYISAFDSPGQAIPALFPKLNIFITNGIDEIFARQMYGAMCHQLKALRCWNTKYEFDTSTDTISFPVLEEVEFVGPCASRWNSKMIESSSKTLHRVLLNCDRTNKMDAMDGRSSSVGHLLLIAKQLKILLIPMNMSCWPRMTDIIAKGIYGVAEQIRSYIQIILRIKCDVICKSDEIMYRSLKIVHELSGSKFEDFMFVCRIKSPIKHRSNEPKQEDLDKEVIRAKRLHGDRFDISCRAKCVVITNKACKISDRDKTSPPYFTRDWNSTTTWTISPTLPPSRVARSG